MNPQLDFRILTNHRIFRFLSVGVLNTVFGYAVYAALLFVNVPYLIALFIATVAGVIFNYFSFGRLVFHSQGGRFVFGKFVISYAIVYLANAVNLEILTKIFLFNPYAGQVICIPISVTLSWIIMNIWVYKKGKCDTR
jgi:putative flippase GtrA